MSKICVCISCFNCYETRMKGVVEYFNDNHYSTKYFISNFNHYDKNTIQLIILIRPKFRFLATLRICQ